MGRLEEAGLGRAGAGERALLVAEQLGFQQVRRERRAVDLHERRGRPGAVVVDRLGQQLLARPRLARQQHRRRAPGDDPRRDPDRLLEPVALADESGEVVLPALLLGQPPGPGVGPRRFRPVQHPGPEPLQVCGQREELGGARPDRLDREPVTRRGAHHRHGAGARRRQLRQPLRRGALLARHHQQERARLAQRRQSVDVRRRFQTQVHRRRQLRPDVGEGLHCLQHRQYRLHGQGQSTA